MLIADMERIEKAIAPLNTHECNSNQFSALCSLAYNIGVTAFANSTLLAKLNSGDIQGAAEEFLKWDHINSVISPGLLNSRCRDYLVTLARIRSR